MPRKFFIFLTAIFIFVFSVLTPATQEKKVIPITTKSQEALDYYHKALHGWDQSDEKAAVENFEKAIRSDSEFVMARAFYSQFLSTPENQKMIDEAKKYFTKVSEGEKLVTLAMEASIKNDTTGAIKLLEEAAAKYPDDGMIHYQLLVFYTQEKRYEKAIEAGKKAVACDRNLYGAYNSLGYGYIRIGNLEEAVKWLGKYSELLPNDANPIDSLGDAYRHAGRYNEAWDCYQKALAIKPDSTGSHIHLGDIKHELGYWEEALSHYRDALKTLLPEKAISESHFRLADAYWRLKLANNYLSMGKLDETEMETTAILQHHSRFGNVPGHYLAAEIALQRGNIKNAKKEAGLVEKFERKDNLLGQEKNQILNFIEAKIALVEDNLALAEKFALAAINAYPQEGQANILTWIYSLGDDRQICVEPLNLLVEIRRKQNRTEDEVQVIKKSLQLIPHQPKLHLRLGQIYTQQNKKEAAAKEFKQFLSLALESEFKCTDDDLFQAGGFIAEFDGYNTLAGKELLKKIKSAGAKNFVLIDCRPEDEFRAGHIPGAVNISIDSLTFGKETVLKSSMEKIQKQAGRKIDFILIDEASEEEYMPKSKWEEFKRALPEDHTAEIIFYCRKPECTRSPRAARWALALDYKNVWRYLGGWKEWSAKKFPVEK